jgi:hypothetical protein
VAVLWSGTAIAHFEEAVGYRDFYGLRVLFGHENPWLPQGHTLGLVQHVLQLLLWGAGLGVEDLDTRINAFIALNAAFWLGFAAYLLYRLCRELPNIGIGITVVGALYLLSNAPTAELYWYAYPDYPSVTLVLAVATALWVWRLVTQDAERELTAGRMMFLGLFAGLAIANKITNLVYPLTIGLLFVVYDRRNLKPLIGAAVISVFVFWVVLVAFYLRLDSGEMYLEGLRTFLLSQIKHVGPLAFVRFFGTLVTSHLWDGLFLAPLLVAVIGVAGVSDVRFRPALACLPGLGFIAYFLFQRYYSWSAIEVYLFIWVCLCTLLFLAITANFRLPKWAFAGAMTVAVCFMAADVARRSEEALRFFAPFSNAYGEMRNAVAGKRVLNLTAGNTYRLISPYSAMCKGGMNIFSPHWGDSRFFLRKFPSYHCEVTDIGDPRLADAEVVIFRRLEPDNLTQAIRRNEEYFKLSLGEFDCSISIPVPLGDFVACLRKQ